MMVYNFYSSPFIYEELYTFSFHFYSIEHNQIFEMMRAFGVEKEENDAPIMVIKLKSEFFLHIATNSIELLIIFKNFHKCYI